MDKRILKIGTDKIQITVDCNAKESILKQVYPGHSLNNNCILLT